MDKKNEVKKAVSLLDEEITSFGKYMMAGAECYKKAAQIYARSIAAHDTAEESYKRAYPAVTAKAWDLFRRIGNGEVVVNALFVTNDVVADKIARLPVAAQTTLIGDEKTPAAKTKWWSGTRIIEKPIADMNSSQFNAVVDVTTGSIRTVEEQKARMEANEKARKSAEAKRDGEAEVVDATPLDCDKYLICNKMLVVKSVTAFDIKELRAIVSKIERS